MVEEAATTVGAMVVGAGVGQLDPDEHFDPKACQASAMSKKLPWKPKRKHRP